MKLTGEQREQLHKALLSAFPTHDDLKMMVSFKLGKNLYHITGEGSLEKVVFELISWAETHGQLDELITQAHVANPGNPDLSEYVEKHLRPRGDIEGVKKRIKALAEEYEQIRSTMSYSSERTDRMEDVVTRMRVQALAAYPLLEDLSKSFSPGERLAAIIILQVQADADYLLWLAERLCVEKAFAGYQASVALLVAAQVLGAEYQARVRAAIKMAQALLKPGWDRGDSDEARVLKQAERVVDQKK